MLKTEALIRYLSSNPHYAKIEGEIEEAYHNHPLIVNSLRQILILILMVCSVSVSLYQSWVQLIVTLFVISFQLYWVFKSGKFFSSTLDLDSEKQEISTILIKQSFKFVKTLQAMLSVQLILTFIFNIRILKK